MAKRLKAFDRRWASTSSTAQRSSSPSKLVQAEAGTTAAAMAEKAETIKAQPALSAILQVIKTDHQHSGSNAANFEKEMRFSIAAWSSQHAPHLATNLLEANGRWETATRHTSNEHLTFELVEPEAVTAIELTLTEAAMNPRRCRMQYSAASIVGPWKDAWAFTVNPVPGQAVFKSSHCYGKTQKRVSDVILAHCGTLDAAWRLVDPNGTGLLSFRDFKHLYHQLLQEDGVDLLREAELPDVPSLFQDLDFHGAGEVAVPDLLCLKKFEPPKASWWRLMVLDNNGSHTCIALGAPLRLFYQPDTVPRLKLRRKSRPSECKVTAFHPETLELKPEVRLLRKVAKSYNRPLTELEDIYEQFRRNGMDENGEIGREAFENVLTSLHGFQDLADMPSSRFEFFWREMDADGNGQIGFEEFLIWYRSNIKTEGGEKFEGLQTKPYRFARGGRRRASMVEMAARAKEAVILGKAMEASSQVTRSHTAPITAPIFEEGAEQSHAVPGQEPIKRSKTTFASEEHSSAGGAHVQRDSSSSSLSAVDVDVRLQLGRRPWPRRRTTVRPRQLSFDSDTE